MARIAVPTHDQVPAASRATLDRIHGAFGTTPAMFSVVAHSPAALQAMWGFFGALGTGTLGARLGELVAVAVANRNGCDYCLAAHAALGKGAGASDADIAAAQRGEAADARSAAAIRFALKVVEARGQVAAAGLQALQAAGFDDGQAVELVAHVALNLFTNYVNNVFDTPVDFPRVARA